MSSLMKRREFIRALGLGAASLATHGCAGLVGKSADRKSACRPNIVLIMADDLGYECLSCHGSASYKTGWPGPACDLSIAMRNRCAHPRGSR